MPQERTKTVTFRITEELEYQLRERASKNGLSLNAFVIKQLALGLEWDPVFHQFDFLHLSKDTLLAFLEHVDDKDIASIARDTGAPLLKEMCIGLYGSSTFENFKRLQEVLVKYEYSWPISFQQFEDSASRRIVLRHGVCRKWSIFIGESVQAYLKGLGLQATYEATNNSTMLTIPLE